MIDDIQVLVSRKRVKNYYLHVLPQDGEVRVTVRVWTSESDIKKFVQPRIAWIKKQIKSFTWQDHTVEKHYVTWELHYFAGEKFPLQLVEKEKGRASVALQDNTIVLSVPVWYTREQKEKALNTWYRRQLEKVLPPVVEKYATIIPVHVWVWKIKKMKSVRWLAHITKKYITINLELMKKPLAALEYIVVHELVHFLEKNHTKRFYALVEHFMPNWKENKKLLSMRMIDQVV